MILNRAEYRSKLLGCWLGKNIGGTLGAPFEWRRQVNDVIFYTQDLSGEPLPNDDLDVQLLWLVALEERGVELDAHTLGEYFLLYVTPHWAEYGMAKINMRSGLQPPLSGMHNNPYKDSCGAFIRSEIWACIAPGCPAVAARYAYEDAIIDHGDGEGVFAAIFCAALESAAFVEHDLRRLIDIGLSYIPAGCGVAGAVRCALAAYDSGKTWREARDALLTDYRGSSFMGNPAFTSAEDRAKGFAEGPRGWDAPSNIGIVALGLLYGAGDFGQTLCTTVNCGEDTDCTAATVGSILGILGGVENIPERWVAPIGHGVKTAFLNLGELQGQIPATVEELTDRVERLARQVILRRGLPVTIADAATDLGGAALMAAADGLLADLGRVVFRFDFFETAVDYGGDPTIRSGEPKAITLVIRNTYKVMENLNLRVLLPEGWRALPAPEMRVFAPNAGIGAPETTVTFALEAGAVTRPVNRCVLELSAEGRPITMLAPLTLLNGAVATARPG